nr:glutamine synthetase family protein [Sinobacterium caligoides]
MLEIKSWLEKNKILDVECLVPDITGNARGKIIPADHFVNEEGMRLPESLFVQTVNGEWSDNWDQLVDGVEPDIVMYPDVKSLRKVPWETATAQIIHDDVDQQETSILARSVLKRVLALYEAEGLKPIVAPEMEFYLVAKNIDPNQSVEPPVGRSGRRETACLSYSVEAVSEFGPLFEEMYRHCDVMGLDVDTLIHEAGTAQYELNFKHGDPLTLADEVFTFKRLLRETAMRHDVYATFMAKPMDEQSGSAMHIHQSIEDLQGDNIFAGEKAGEYTEAFNHYIGGLQKYLRKATALTAPNVNSYRRFMRDNSAPINLQWGVDNRTVGLRVPIANRRGTRIENRLPGADANPYIAMAVTLACGYLGMKEKLTPTEAITGSAYDEDFDIPRNLEYALRLLQSCDALKEVLGERFVKSYISIKEKEYEDFFSVITPWEREHLLRNV